MARGPRRLLLLAFSVLVFAAATVTRADADLWGHLRFGLDTLHDRQLVSVDPYSFTQDTPWINHEWLSELQMAIAWSLAGSAGLVLLKGALVFASLVVIWSAIQRFTIGLQVGILLLCVIGTIHMWAFVRPQLWTLLCFSILCRALTARVSTRTWALPLLFAFWANCHGGWIVGLGALGAWGAAAAIVDGTDRWRWICVFLLSVLATLANPYGWQLWIFMLRTVRLTRSVTEWQPLWTAPGLNWLPWMAALAGALWIAGRGGERLRWRAVIVLLPLAYAALRVQRLESLLVVGAAILLPPGWLTKRPTAQLNGDPAASKSGATIFSLGFGGAALVLAGVIMSTSLRCIQVFGDWAPEGVVARVLSSASPGRMVTFFDWGEFAIWHFGPRLRISMDGRRETVYSEARLREHDAIVAGSDEGLATLGSWQAEYVWLPATSVRTRQWLLGHGYRVDFDGPRSFVAVRIDLPRLVAQASSPAADCFPQ